MSKQQEADLALKAYDAATFMHIDGVRSGFLPKDAARNLAMQAAITAVDELRRTGVATVMASPEDPIFRLPMAAPEPAQVRDDNLCGACGAPWGMRHSEACRNVPAPNGGRA